MTHTAVYRNRCDRIKARLLTGFFECNRNFGVFYRIKFSSGSLILNFVMSKEGVKMVVLSSGGEKCNISE